MKRLFFATLLGMKPNNSLPPISRASNACNMPSLAPAKTVGLLVALSSKYCP